MYSPKTYGYGVAPICAVIAAAHAPGLTHRLHWKATLIWGVIAVLAAAIAFAFLPEKTRA
jgi:MFS-type transporter involved in bile tolerance (Atg22 family)